jgi:hypothetical protein
MHWTIKHANLKFRTSVSETCRFTSYMQLQRIYKLLSDRNLREVNEVVRRRKLYEMLVSPFGSSVQIYSRKGRMD